MNELIDSEKPIKEEKEPVTIDKVKTILSDDTSNELNEFIVQMATMVRDGQLDQGACKSQINQMTNSMKEYAKKKLPAVVEVVTDTEEIPFDEDKKKDPKKKDKKNKKSNEVVIEGEYREVKEQKKPQEAMKYFPSQEEAIKAAEEETKKEKKNLEKVDVLPPVTTQQIILNGAEKPIESDKVKQVLYPLFDTSLRGEPYEIVKCENGFYNLKVAGEVFPIDNNSIIRNGPQLIVDIVLFDPVFGQKRLPEFVSVKMRPDIVYEWTHNPQLRAIGITDPQTVQELRRDRKLPYEIIRQIDLSCYDLPNNLPDNEKLVNNLMALLNHPEMKAIPGIKYRFKKYVKESKFTLVSDKFVKAPMLLFNSSIPRYAEPEFTIAFNNPNNIKIMYNGCTKRFSLNGGKVEEEDKED